jgi:hypothetical protein
MRDMGAPVMNLSVIGDSLAALGDAHATMGIRPPVISYNQHSQKVHITDQSLLFFRRYGFPKWPWP